MPPSPPSMVMKSTPRVPSSISSASSSQKPRSPTADLMPTGSPVRSAMVSTKSSISSTEENAEWREGLATSLPSSTPRIRAISAFTLAPGRWPPSPGFAPWLSLISTARTGADSTTSTRRSRSKFPSASRQPK